VPPVAVRLLHAHAAPGAGPLERSLAAVRRDLADRLAASFRRAGADDVRVVAGSPDDTPFGGRLRELVRHERPAGLVLAGSGSVPLATTADLRAFVDTAGSGERIALANNRYSSDLIAVAQAERLVDLPELPGDNALPRWLAEVAGYAVRDLRGRRRLGVDVDGPLDAVLVRAPWPEPAETAAVRDRLDAVAAVARDPRRELLLAGRTSGATLGWLERRVACRVRALVEERGLRAAAAAARSDGMPNVRPPRSVLGLLLDRAGPEALGAIVGGLGDAAVVDSRVLLAHRLGADERRWPAAEDRFASDLLLPERIADPWLRALTVAAREGAVPVVLGGHTLVGPGLPLALTGAW